MCVCVCVYKNQCARIEDSDQPVQPRSLISLRLTLDPKLLNAYSKVSDKTAQAHKRLRWVLMLFCRFLACSG